MHTRHPLSLLLALTISLMLIAQPVRPTLAATDSDSDGIADATEISIGTDPNNVDSDCDFVNDGTEVGDPAAPKNTDGTGTIDALEGNNADSNKNGVKDDQDVATNVQLTCGRFLPFAIANNDSDTSRIEVWVTQGTAVSTVTVKAPAYTGPTSLKVDGVGIESNATISLYDDGTHGDQRAGDGLWTRGGFTSTADPLSLWATWFDFSTFTVTGSAGTTTINLADKQNGPFAPDVTSITLGVVNAALVAAPTPLGTGVQATSNLYNIIDPLGSLDVKDSFNTYTREKAVSKLFYSKVPGDDYDFIYFFQDASIPAPYVAFHHHVSNQIQGIGQDSFDNTVDFGSSGKLKGIQVMTFGSNGPTLHETEHQWATPDLTSLGFHQCWSPGHWGVSGVGEGQLGGFDPSTLVDNHDGTYTVRNFGLNGNRSDRVNYVPLELYLAGFLDAGAVPDVTIPIGVDCSSLNSGENTTTFKASGLKKVSISQIQAALGGARVPDVTTSQKQFKAAPLIVSQYPLNPAEMAFFNGWAKNLGAKKSSVEEMKTFYEATGGVAQMDTTVIPSASTTPPAIQLKGNNTVIASGSNTPNTADGTDFGSASVYGGSVEHTFTIENTGGDMLNLTSYYIFKIEGTGKSDFSIKTDPKRPIAPGTTTTFTVRFTPLGLGLRTATISIPNNDSTKDPYTFTIQGVGSDTTSEQRYHVFLPVVIQPGAST